MYKIREAVLETVIGTRSEVPQNGIMEVAFAGKSNVGKSSLINTLLMRKSLARTSAQPGKTRTINYYHVNKGTKDEEAFLESPFAPDCLLVDLPGYGYTNAAEEVRMTWGKMVERYLHASKSLSAVFLLVDIRHAPSANDRLMYDWMRAQGMAPLVIATKKDKLKRSQVPKALKVIRETLGTPKGTEVIAFSAQTKEGADEVWKIIADLKRGGLLDTGVENGDN